MRPCSLPRLTLGVVALALLAALALTGTAHAATAHLTKPRIGTVQTDDASGQVCGPGCTSANLAGPLSCDGETHPVCVYETLQLIAVDDAGARFVGWNGCPTPSGTTCTIRGGKTDFTADVYADFADTAPPTVDTRAPQAPTATTSTATRIPAPRTRRAMASTRTATGTTRTSPASVP